MDRRQLNLNWSLICGLGSLALIRPLASIVETQMGSDTGPVLPLGLTLLVTAAWVAIVGLSREPRPLLTLVLAGVAYAVFAALLSGILSRILTGELQGPFAMPLAIIPMLLVNALWGLVAGALALAVRRVRGIHPPTEPYPLPPPSPALPVGEVAPGQPPVALAAPRTGGGLRSVGIGALGLIGGVLAAMILQDIIGVAFLRDGGEGHLGLAMAIGLLMPILSIAGVGVALAVDYSARSRRAQNTPPGRR